MSQRKIIHIDMDAFYASIEQRDTPQLKGKPVVVGGAPDSRGVACTCSYEARKLGIHSAMPCYKAYKLCPNAVFIRPNMAKYKSVSTTVRKIFHRYTDIIEPLSLDEAFLDITNCKKNIKYATDVAKEILRTIKIETELTASAGVSYNKFLAKIASDYRKPYGLTIITPNMAEKFLNDLPITKFFGVGKVTAKKLIKVGINTGYDLKQLSIEELLEFFGSKANSFYDIVRGIDERPVDTSRERKSFGKEITLKENTSDLEIILFELSSQCKKLCNYQSKEQLSARTITIKVKYADFTTCTRSISFKTYRIFTSKELLVYCDELLKSTDIENERQARLVGVTISNFEDKSTPYYQPLLDFKD